MRIYICLNPQHDEPEWAERLYLATPEEQTPRCIREALFACEPLLEGAELHFRVGRETFGYEGSELVFYDYNLQLQEQDHG